MSTDNINRVFLLGHVKHTPEIRATRDGHLIAQFTLLTQVSVPSLDGSTKEQSEWHNLVAYGENAMHVRSRVKPEDVVLVEGVIRSLSYMDRQTQIKRHRTEIVVCTFHQLTAASRLYSLLDEPEPVLS